MILGLYIAAAAVGDEDPGAGEFPPAQGSKWTGEAKTCYFGSYVWSNGSNWTDCGTCPPTSGDIDISAANVCNPCDFCSCELLTCNPTCYSECLGGPNSGEECTDIGDCECCTGGSFVADFNYSDSTPYTFDIVWVLADADDTMKLTKSSSNSTFMVTGAMYMAGNGSNQATLEAAANGFVLDAFYSCGNVDITGPGTTSVGFVDTFQAGHPGCDEDTTVTIDGTDIDVTGDTVIVSPTGYKSTLVLDSTAITVGDLEIRGQGSTSSEAKYQHDSPSELIEITGLTMSGYSWLDVNREVEYGGDGDPDNPISTFTVESSGYETIARVDLDPDSTLWATNVNVTSSGDDDATLRPVSGTIKSLGTVTLAGSETNGSDATLFLDVGDGALVLNHVVLNERGVLDLRISIEISGDLKLTADSDDGGTPGAELKLGQNVVLTANQIKVDASAGGIEFSPQFASGALVRNFTPTP